MTTAPTETTYCHGNHDCQKRFTEENQIFWSLNSTGASNCYFNQCWKCDMISIDGCWSCAEYNCKCLHHLQLQLVAGQVHKFKSNVNIKLQIDHYTKARQLKLQTNKANKPKQRKAQGKGKQSESKAKASTAKEAKHSQANKAQLTHCHLNQQNRWGHWWGHQTVTRWGQLI